MVNGLYTLSKYKTSYYNTSQVYYYSLSLLNCYFDFYFAIETFMQLNGSAIHGSSYSSS